LENQPIPSRQNNPVFVNSQPQNVQMCPDAIGMQIANEEFAFFFIQESAD
jgi:hypothetical protein